MTLKTVWEPVTVYECPICYRAYKYSGEAYDCCCYEAKSAWECSNCGQLSGRYAGPDAPDFECKNCAGEPA